MYQKSFMKDNELTPSQFNLRDWFTYLTSTQKEEEEDDDEELKAFILTRMIKANKPVGLSVN